MIKVVFSMLLSYFIGSISGSFLLGKFLKGIDIRQHGSGNAGTTNAMRIMGRKLGSFTFIIDLLKGYISLFILSRILPFQYLLLGGLFCVLGHDYPFYMHFKGGKGIATSLGALLYIHPLFSLLGVIAGVLTALISKYVSLGSMVFLSVSTVLYILYLPLGLINSLSLVAICFLGIYRHKSNIKKIKSGQENKIGGILWIK